MKVIITLVITATLVVGEVPPPYAPRGFRPSPSFNLPNILNHDIRNQPQSAYTNPPLKQSLAPSVNFQSLQGIRQPQLEYGSPAPEGRPLSSPQNIYRGPQSLHQPQLEYGTPVPDGRPSGAQNIYKGPQSGRQPQLEYGAPVAGGRPPCPQNIYRGPENAAINNNRPQTLYDAPLQQQRIPQTQYGVPDLEAIRQSSKQSEIPINIRPNLEYGAPIPDRRGQNVGRLETGVFVQQIHKNNQHTVLNNNQPHRSLGTPVEQHQSEQTQYGAPDVETSGSSSQKPNNLQIPSTQYLPVLDPADFQQGFRVLQNSIPNRQSSYLEDYRFNERGILQLSNQQSQRNVYVSPQQQRPLVTSSRPVNNQFRGDDNFRTSVDVQKLEVRKLVQPIITGRSNREFEENRDNTPAGRTINNNFQNSIVTPNSGRVEENYLPPTTTSKPIKRTSRRPRPRPSATTTTTEVPENEEDTTDPDVPNVAVSNAFAGRLYLLQPDSSRQQITSQGSAMEEPQTNQYTTDYRLQNLQLLPHPLIALNTPLLAYVK